MHISHGTAEKRGTSHLLVFVRLSATHALVPVLYYMYTISIDTWIGFDTRYFRRKLAQYVKCYCSTNSIMLMSCK